MENKLPKLSQEELIERYASGERDFSMFDISLSPYKYNKKKKIRLKNNLSGINLSDANLANLNVSGCILKHANFSNSNLSNVSIGNYADLSDANLSNADLSNANLSNVDFSNADLSGVDFSSASFNAHYKNQPKINFSGANLTNVVFPNDYSSYVDFSGVDFSNADLSGVDLRKVVLMGAILSGTKLEKARGILADEKLVWKIVNGHAINEDISEFYLSGANFSRVDLRDINLSGANLAKCVFTGSNLENADLSNANLEEADFSNANLTNANLSRSNLAKAVFHNVNLMNTNFEKANTNKIVDSKTNFNNAVKVSAHFLQSKEKTPLIIALDKILDYYYKYNPDIILCLQPGLNRREIDELLDDIPYTIPEEIYQLYGWRNGMSKKGIINYGYLAFAKAKGFRPLEEAVKYYKYTSRYSKRALEIFPSANDHSASYAIDLGDNDVAPVRNFDTEHNNSYEAFETKYYSILGMMSSCNSRKR